MAREGGLRLRPAHVAAVVAAVAAALGYWGYSRVGGPPLSVSDRVFSALQLFSLNTSVPEGGTPWQLDVARFLAPATVVYAAAATALALLRERAVAAAVRRRASGHVVLVAPAESGPAMAAGLRGLGHEVVLVEATGRPIAAPEADGVRHLPGDPANATVLEGARVDRASHVVVMPGDDTRALEITGLSRRLGGSARVHVDIRNLALWRELSVASLEPTDFGRLQYVNASDTVAQLLLDRAERDGGGSVTRAVVEGSDGTAVRLLVHLVRRAQLVGGRASVVLSGPDGDEALAQLRRHEAWCLSAADLEVRTAGPDDGPGFVCAAADTAESYARGIALARAVGARPVYVAVSGQWGRDVPRPPSGPASRVQLVGLSHAEVATWALQLSALEILARARHEDYLRQERERGGDTSSNPSLQPWEDLPESLRVSNRRFAESVAELVQGLGGAIVPLTGSVTVPELPLGPDRLEAFARSEHDRWSRDLLADGWRPTDGPKDAVKKLHPLLVPWDHLDEAEQQKDVDGLLAIPAMLARAGYGLALAEPPDPVAR